MKPMKHVKRVHSYLAVYIGSFGATLVIILVVLGIIFFGYTKLRQPQDNLAVPFSSQAPAGNWAEPWQNACEETSIIMIDNFYNGDTVTKTQAKQEILNIFTIKNAEFGKSKDESMELIAEIINSAKLIWQARVVVNPTLEQMKQEIADNHPIIAPVYAPALANTPYPTADLNYHVMVISGYDDAKGEFIVQDPGSSQGKDNHYTYTNFYEAIHDYLNTTDYELGRKAVLFTEKR
ncbi:MAG: C39 family peptidase [Candidatus Komeilibacteria bacterium]